MTSAPRALVIHVITRLEWGGAQENTLKTVAGLDPERFERLLAAGRGGRLDPEAARIPGCRFVPIGPLVREIRPLCDMKAFLALAAVFRRARREAGGLPVIVHTHSSKAGILGRAAARAAGVDAVVHSVHGFGFHEGQSFLRRGLFVALERLASRWTDVFIAVSEENVRLGTREGIFTPARCRLIRSGFDTSRFLSGSRERGRRLMGVPEGVPVVGTIAVFKPQKAPQDFVEAARRTAARVPGVHFAMVGDGDLRPAAEQAVAAAGLSGVFRFLGWREEVPDLLKAFDVFLLTSRWEGLPKVVPQALIAGVPVVATAVDGTREIVSDGIDGFLVTPGDTEGMARRVADLLSGRAKVDPSFKRDRLLGEFCGDAMVRRQENLYAELLAAKGGASWGR